MLCCCVHGHSWHKRICMPIACDHTFRHLSAVYLRIARTFPLNLSSIQLHQASAPYFLPSWQHRKYTAAAMSATPTTTPIPMPALAPEDNPPPPFVLSAALLSPPLLEAVVAASASSPSLAVQDPR